MPAENRPPRVLPLVAFGLLAGGVGMLAVALRGIESIRMVGPVSQPVTTARILSAVERDDFDWLLKHRGLISRMASVTQDEELRQAALAALVTCDGDPRSAWRIASADIGGLGDLAQAITILPDAATRILVYDELVPQADRDAPPDPLPADPAAWLDFRRKVIVAMSLVPDRGPATAEALERWAAVPELSEAIAEARANIANGMAGRARHRASQPAANFSEAIAWVTTSSTPRSLARGRRLFSELRCATCHASRSGGSSWGPALAAPIEAEHAVRSLIEPQAKVSDEYRESQVQRGGETLTGLIIEQGPTDIVLIVDPLGTAQRMRIPLAELDSPPQLLTTSPMPAGLVDSLSRDELLDLVAYVTSGCETGLEAQE